VKFCKNVPLAAKRMFAGFESQFSVAEIKRIVTALASDERMETVWPAIQNWNDSQIEHFVRLALLFADPNILTDLTLPPEQRLYLSKGPYSLQITAEQFAEAIEANRAEAAMFWPGIVEDILPKLHAFSKQQYDYGFGLWSSIQDITAPNRRGKGEPREIAYGNAMTRTLESILALTRDKQEQVIATLTEVVFGYSTGEKIDPDRIKARRKRARRKSRAPSR